MSSPLFDATMHTALSYISISDFFHASLLVYATDLFSSSKNNYFMTWRYMHMQNWLLNGKYDDIKGICKMKYRVEDNLTKKQKTGKKKQSAKQNVELLI